MAVSNANKQINKEVLDCCEKANVTISFDSKSELIARSADIILLLDTSSSMIGERLIAAKKGAIDLINLISTASGGVDGDTIANNSRMGLIGFASVAQTYMNLTDNAKFLRTSVNTMTASGSTNHEDAFIKAANMIDPQSTNDKIVIMFTDGLSTAGGDANVEAEKLKQSGAEIFCISLGTDRTKIDQWASKPIDTHVASTNEVNELESVFKKIAYEVIKAGAKDVTLTETLNPDFKITKVLNAVPGTVEIKDLQTLEWKMDAVGITDNDNAKLEFEIQYIGNENKTIQVNKSLIYNDRDNNVLTFPNPLVKLTCNTTVIVPDPYKTATTIEMEGCVDAKTLTVEATSIQDLGRIVEVEVPIKNVCPNKRVALGVILTEIDPDGVEHNRGIKTLLIDPIVSEKCENVLVKCINFVVPEAIDVTGSPDSLCNTRQFKARVLVNYVDTDFVCCNPETVIVE